MSTRSHVLCRLIIFAVLVAVAPVQAQQADRAQALRDQIDRIFKTRKYDPRVRSGPMASRRHGLRHRRTTPVPDQRLYDTIYQGRYMGLPKDNAEGYRIGSPINFAAGL